MLLRTVIPGIACLFVAVARLASVQASQTAESLTCTFTSAAAGTWTAQGGPQVDRKTASLTLVFDRIDLQEGSARVSGPYAANDIIVKQVGGTLHFLAVGSAGPVALTSVFDSPTRAGARKAVHSRHDYVDSTLPGFNATPEQYYGECGPTK
jgi:hypothetical protein